jgi:hypothetical protein
MLKEHTIRGFYGSEISHEVFIEKVKEYSKKGFDVYVGSDSQIIKKKVSFVTCVCLYKQGTGKSEIYYVKVRIPVEHLPTLRARILHEAYKSLEAALEVDPYVEGKLTVHLDIGSNMKKNKTAKFKNELQMLIKSQGFGCEVKPDSWASSSVADRFTKS